MNPVSSVTPLPAGICQPDARAVERAIRLTYAQMMLNAVFGASTGGMFLIGFAIGLGADNVMLGLMSTLPQFFVVFQILAAWLVEREVSRKKLTVIFAFVTPLCWFLIAGIPFLGEHASKGLRFTILIGTIAAVTLAAQFVGNARASWIGELIPAERRGRFFGYCAMFAGVVGAAFAIIEGRFLDVIGSYGLVAFTALFFFGSIFGLIAAVLNLPQPDCPLPGAGRRPAFAAQIRQAMSNRPFWMLALVHAVVALGGVAGPFNAAYLLRDVGLSFFQLGLLNAVATVAALIGSAFWGKLVDRFGCRPILILGLSLMGPCGLIWLAIPPHAMSRALWLLPWTNFIAGFAGSAFGIALSTMMYKTSHAEGRSVQFALYGIFVTLVGAPMPLVGGWLVSTLETSGWNVDLRLTFYLWVLFILAAAVLAKRLREPESVRTRVLVFEYFPERIAAWFGETLLPAVGTLLPFGWLRGASGNDDDKRGG